LVFQSVNVMFHANLPNSERWETVHELLHKRLGPNYSLGTVPETGWQDLPVPCGRYEGLERKVELDGVDLNAMVTLYGPLYEYDDLEKTLQYLQDLTEGLFVWGGIALINSSSQGRNYYYNESSIGEGWQPLELVPGSMPPSTPPPQVIYVRKGKGESQNPTEE